jgi:hypothetical protein
VFALQESISFERTAEEAEIFRNYIEKYLKRYPDTTRMEEYLPSGLEVLEQIQREAEFYKLDGLKNAASDKYERTQFEQLARKSKKESRESVPAG